MDTEHVSSLVKNTGQGRHPRDPSVRLNSRADNRREELDHCVPLLWQQYVSGRQRVVLYRNVVGEGEPREGVELISHPVRCGRHLHRHRLQCGESEIVPFNHFSLHQEQNDEPIVLYNERARLLDGNLAFPRKDRASSPTATRLSPTSLVAWKLFLVVPIEMDIFTAPPAQHVC